MPERVVFIHGWSVASTATYGELPARLARDLRLDVQHLHLAKYVSFDDQVRVSDLAFALEAAIQREVKLADGERFAVITHSTGGPIVRTWWETYYHAPGRACPMSHVIHLAAAQFGSALARMGKGPLSRSKSLLQGIEPGIGVLDWLALGSPESWELNQRWIRARHVSADTAPVFSFCLGGQQIDRKFYDTLNSYTGEMGSDGVVRVAASNLNAAALRLIQRAPTATQYANKTPSLLEPDADGLLESEPVPFAIVPGVAHSGGKMGIMNAVRNNAKRYPVLPFLRKCLEVTDHENYLALCEEFEARNLETIGNERVEIEDRILLESRVFLHDACSMVILRVTDDHGKIPEDLRINFTGPGHDPNRLPAGFHLDTQRNSRHRGTFTYFFNHDVLQGCTAIHGEVGGKRRKVREALPGIQELGIVIEAFPDEGFARYHPCHARPSADFLRRVIRPHGTVLIDVVLKRVIHEGTFRITNDLRPRSFKDTKPGKEIGQ